MKETEPNPNTTGGRIAALQAAITAETGVDLTNAELAERGETVRENLTKWKKPTHRLQQMETRRCLAKAFALDLHMFNAYVDGETPLEIVLPVAAKGVAAARKREERAGSWIPRPNLYALLAEPRDAETPGPWTEDGQPRWPRHVITFAEEIRIARDLSRAEWIEKLDFIARFVPHELIENVVLGPRRHSRVQKLPKS